MEKLSPAQLHVIQHSLGCDDYGRGTQYRNRYVTDPDPICDSLVALGLMTNHGPQTIAGGMHCYSVTDEGKRVMAEQSPQPPKVSRSKSRYLKWLRIADAFGSDMTFGEALKRKLI